MTRKLSLKIDVDTREGMENGVPRMLDRLKALGVHATFFLSFGPDNSGKAIWNVFRQKGFLKKMRKSGGVKLYGLRTVLSGTLLPARPIASALPDLVRRIDEEGHEVGTHAWDHRQWQDHLSKLSVERVAEHLDSASGCFAEILGRPPRATAAPGWRANAVSLAKQDTMDLDYSSDCRGDTPFVPRIGETTFGTLQIPTSLPCPEELMTDGIMEEEALAEGIRAKLRPDALNVYPAHSEVEGHPKFDAWFGRLVESFLEDGYAIVPLRDIAAALAAGDRPPVREMIDAPWPGRSCPVATHA